MVCVCITVCGICGADVDSCEDRDRKGIGEGGCRLCTDRSRASFFSARITLLTDEEMNPLNTLDENRSMWAEYDDPMIVQYAMAED